VEPDPRNARLLKRNVSSLGERVVVIEGAVRDRPGFAHFDNAGWSWGGQIARNGSPRVEVRCYTMDEVMETAGLSTIDVLKVDIENGVEALFGSNNAWLARVRTIVVELTSAYPLPAFTRDVTPYGLTVLPAHSIYGNQMVMAVRVNESSKVRAGRSTAG
jgi:FkbM family methyltransferase